jgi:hypothetical protein
MTTNAMSARAKSSGIHAPEARPGRTSGPSGATGREEDR